MFFFWSGGYVIDNDTQKNELICAKKTDRIVGK